MTKDLWSPVTSTWSASRRGSCSRILSQSGFLVVCNSHELRLIEEARSFSKVTRKLTASPQAGEPGSEQTSIQGAYSTAWANQKHAQKRVPMDMAATTAPGKTLSSLSSACRPGHHLCPVAGGKTPSTPVSAPSCH